MDNNKYIWLPIIIIASLVWPLLYGRFDVKNYQEHKEVYIGTIEDARIWRNIYVVGSRQRNPNLGGPPVRIKLVEYPNKIFEIPGVIATLPSVHILKHFNTPSDVYELDESVRGKKIELQCSPGGEFEAQPFLSPSKGIDLNVKWNATKGKELYLVRQAKIMGPPLSLGEWQRTHRGRRP